MYYILSCVDTSFLNRRERAHTGILENLRTEGSLHVTILQCYVGRVLQQRTRRKVAGLSGSPQTSVCVKCVWGFVVLPRCTPYVPKVRGSLDPFLRDPLDLDLWILRIFRAGVQRTHSSVPTDPQSVSASQNSTPQPFFLHTLLRLPSTTYATCTLFSAALGTESLPPHIKSSNIFDHGVDQGSG